MGGYDGYICLVILSIENKLQYCSVKQTSEGEKGQTAGTHTHSPPTHEEKDRPTQNAEQTDSFFFFK